MALSSKNTVLASDYVSIKARVKAEMNRRCRSGSLTAYAGTSYDYTVAPSVKGTAKVEHYNKIIIPLRAINTTDGAEVVSKDTIMAMEPINTLLSAHENYPMRGSGTDCASGCSGLCSSGCWNSCSGCGGSCSYGCSGDCEGSCSGTCSGSCGDGCTATCGTCRGCSTNCWGGCDSNCWGVSRTGSGNGSSVK